MTEAPTPDNYQRLVTKLWDDPNLGSSIRKAAKELIPDLRLPEDTLAPALEPLRKQNEELAATLKALQEDRAAEKKSKEEADKASKDAEFEQRIKAAREEFRLSDAGFDAMIARMKETGNYTDPRAAAALVVAENPPPAPAGPMYGNSDLNFAGSSTIDPKYQLLHQNPEKYFDSEVRAMLSNPRDYVAKEMGEQYATLAFGR